MALPTDSEARKRIPLATGCFDYFPDALAAVAEVSFVGNEKHNPGEPLHWSREKSNDHPDCLLRHFMSRGQYEDVTVNGRTYRIRHSAEMAWRALAILQLELEAARDAEQEAPPTQADAELASRDRHFARVLAGEATPYVTNPEGLRGLLQCTEDHPCPVCAEHIRRYGK